MQKRKGRFQLQTGISGCTHTYQRAEDHSKVMYDGTMVPRTRTHKQATQICPSNETNTFQRSSPDDKPALTPDAPSETNPQHRVTAATMFISYRNQWHSSREETVRPVSTAGHNMCLRMQCVCLGDGYSRFVILCAGGAA